MWYTFTSIGIVIQGAVGGFCYLMVVEAHILSIVKSHVVIELTWN